MERLADLIPDKEKYLKNLALEPPAVPKEVIAPPSFPVQTQEEAAQTAPIHIPVTKPLDNPEAELMRMTLHKIKDQVDILLHLLDETASFIPLVSSPPAAVQKVQTLQTTSPEVKLPPDNTRIIEGIFIGDKMRSDDGEIFDVPQNYASKSKLVEGDRMKLTIPSIGAFVYKQISQVERTRVRGELVSGSSSGQWLVASEEKNYKVLTASVTFNKGRIGDEVILIVPAFGASQWGAIEHIIHKEL